MKYLLSVLVVPLVLAGCSSSTPLVQSRINPPPIPANLMSPCPPLPLLVLGTLPELASRSLTDALMYSDCAKKHQLLTQAVKSREESNE